jgi:hypothetical protein
MRVLVALFIYLITQMCVAAQGFIEKNGTRMDVVDSFAVLDKVKGKLTIYLLPSRLSADEKQKVMGKNAFFVLVDKPSPDSKKWSWYPYAKLELSNKQGKFNSKNDIGGYYLMAYGVKKKNYTDNLNGNLKYDKSVVLDNYRRDGKRVSFQFRGKEDFFKIRWQLNIAAEIQ